MTINRSEIIHRRHRDKILHQGERLVRHQRFIRRVPCFDIISSVVAVGFGFRRRIGADDGAGAGDGFSTMKLCFKEIAKMLRQHASIGRRRARRRRMAR